MDAAYGRMLASPLMADALIEAIRGGNLAAVRTAGKANPEAVRHPKYMLAAGQLGSALALEYGVFGGTGWSLSTESTNTVDAASGANHWTSSTASGQYYLTTTNSPQCFENLLSFQWVSPESSAAPAEARCIHRTYYASEQRLLSPPAASASFRTTTIGSIRKPFLLY